MAGQASERPEARRRDLLVTLGLVLASAILLYLPTSAQRSIAQALKATILSPFIQMNGALTRAGDRARDFDVLRAQMDSALTLLAAQRTLAEENRQLRGILDLRDRSATRLVAATVLRTGTPGAESVFQIDVGANSGVRRFNAVVTPLGLLGQVQDVYGDEASVIDWSHPDFRVSAMTLDGQVHGLVEPRRGLFREQDRLVLQGTAFLSDLDVGTELVTSGRGGVFPRGIRIGWIADVAETSAGWSKSYYVDAAVYPGAVTHALVDVGTPDASGAGEGPSLP